MMQRLKGKLEEPEIDWEKNAQDKKEGISVVVFFPFEPKQSVILLFSALNPSFHELNPSSLPCVPQHATFFVWFLFPVLAYYWKTSLAWP